MRPNLHRAAQAIADYFNTIEAKRGELIKDVFNNQLIDGKPTVNVIGVPVPMLRALIAALPAEAQTARPGFDPYSGR